MKKLTSFSNLNTGEGSRIAFTYSEVSDTGMVLSQGNKGNALVINEELQYHLEWVRQFIADNYLAE